MRKRRWILAVVAVLALPAGMMFSQQKAQPPKAPPGVPENELVDYMISEMLAAWQIGDTNLLHTYYADDVSVVSGAYEPPLIGWAKFLQAYQQQRARIQSVQVTRRNTYTVVRGNLAWCAYQWEFGGVVEGNNVFFRGHTTLVMEKRGGKWAIVHNHTSVVPETPPAAPPKQ